MKRTLNKNLIKVAFLFLFLLSVTQAGAQYFEGTKGSIYNPTINTPAQPAAGANMPYRWTVEIAGVNAFWTNNMVSASPVHKDWRKDTIYPERYFIPGPGKRWGMVKGDVNFLNFLFRLPGHEKWVVGAGWNVRSHTFADKLDYNYQDSMSTFDSFMKVNAVNKAQRGRLVNHQWMEWFINASTVLRENNDE